MMTRTLLLILPLALLLAGCGTTRIGRVLQDPSRFHNRPVTVEGRVVNVVGALNMGAYEVDDGTGKIYVLSNRGVPGRNTTVKVSGTVTPGLNIMGKTIGTAIKESSHRVRH
jgi:hypothetical protein